MIEVGEPQVRPSRACGRSVVLPNMSHDLDNGGTATTRHKPVPYAVNGTQEALRECSVLCHVTTV